VIPTDPHQVVLRPVVTEKSLRTSERRNAYTFVVHMKANKVQIRRAVESLFKVDVLDVRTDIRAGKPRRVGWHVTETPRVKRAVVTIKAGQTIDVY
jgi:large subunit ribosomal protein L23